MSRRRALCDIAAAAGVFASALVYFLLFHRLGWFVEDEGVLYYHYLRVYHGQVPYRDFFTGYGPIGYYLHAWAFALFGVSINAVRVLTAVVNATTAAGLYCVARRVTSPRYALIPPALFVVAQPWDIAVMVFQNSPYPSWYALAFAVWGTWAMLRFLEVDDTACQRAWLILAGVFGGLAFFTKQNTGTFFLWGITGFLASHPASIAGESEEAERPAQRIARCTYLALAPLGTLLLIRNFLDVATLAAFILPVTALALIGMWQPFARRAWRHLVTRILYVTTGVAIAIIPWLVYFAAQMGTVPFLNAILFLGAEVDRNLFVPFPAPTATVLLILALVAVWVVLLRRARAGFRVPLATALLLTALGAAGVGLWHAGVIGRVLRFEYNLWQTYAFVSERIDNLAAYLALVILAAGLAVAWRHASGRAQTDRSTTAFLCVLWVGACSFIAYYPRMDYAHLVGAVPLVLVVGAALVPRLRRLAAADSGYRRLCFDALCATLVLFVIGMKSAPKVYSRVMVARTDGGLSLVPTPQETLSVERAHLYFPIYLQRQRLHIAAFEELIQYLQQTTGQDERIFAFPALPMVYFLSGRDNPTRHDYFLGDNVSFREQLEVIRRLEEQQVATVVVDNDLTNYFVVKSREFTRLMWDYLRQRYYLERRIGPYDVLRRYGVAPRDNAGTE